MEQVEESPKLFRISDMPEKCDSFSAILYNKGISFEHDHEEVEENSPKPRSSRMCFNCGKADHCLRDCPRPPNYSKIARNRMNFRGNSKSDREFRYHKEIDDRFSSFRPGTISDKLREALGLSKDRLPRYIYNMRVLGYPPGWLEEAKISHSGISMLDSNGERVPDADEEEGEICTTKIRYDPEKIIDYPGFNVWPDPGTINETDLYGSSPMSYDQNKEVFIERLNQSSFFPDSSKESEISSNLNLQHDNMDVEELDIDIKYDNDNVNVGFVPPLPEDVPKPPPPPPPEELQLSEGEIVSVSEDNDSEQEEGELPCKIRRTKDLAPKVYDEKNKLLPLSTVSLSPKEDTSPTIKLIDDMNNSTSSTVDLNVTPTDTSSIKSEDTFGRVKSVEFGTPVVNHSSYTSLPPTEKFRKDISDVIYFENLPNSTGKYERLKSVLKNVRSRLNILKGDSSKK